MEPWLEADEVESREQLLKLLEKELDEEDILVMVMGREDEWLEDGEVPGEVSKCMLVLEMLNNTVAVIKINHGGNVGMGMCIYRLPDADEKNHKPTTRLAWRVVTSMLAAFRITGSATGQKGEMGDGAEVTMTMGLPRTRQIRKAAELLVEGWYGSSLVQLSATVPTIKVGQGRRNICPLNPVCSRRRDRGG